MPMQPTSAGSRFGRAIAGRVIGIYGLMGLPFSLTAIPLGGLIKSATGSYDGIFIAGIGIIGLVLFMLSIARFKPE